jgi:hypothetical protein
MMKRRNFLSATSAALAGAASRRVALAAGETGGISLRTLNGGLIEIDSAAVGELRAGLHGDFLVKGNPEYDGARTIWNAAIDRHPAAIIRCADTEDIVNAVRFAQRHSVLLSVRGGGHNHVGFALCDGGLTIDLTRLHSVEVDPTKRTAKVGGGSTFAEYDARTHEAGLASTGPII